MRLLLCSMLIFPAAAGAHQAGVSYGELSIRGERVELAVRGSAAELSLAFPDSAVATAGEVLRTWSVTRSGAPCALSPGLVVEEPTDGVRIAGAFRCGSAEGPIDVRVGLVERMPPGHTHLVKVEAGGRLEEHVVRSGHDSFRVQADSFWVRCARLVALGVEHIFTGYDHLAFLIGLLLLGGTLGDLARVVTSFTAAHSVTLALAALGVVSPPAGLVEPLIAASVVWVAVENLRVLRRGGGGGLCPPAERGRSSSDPRRGRGPRARLGFAFGLVHGLGFAGVLRGLALPASELGAALVSFNVGVELGQAAVGAAVFPLLAGLRRLPRMVPNGLRAGSVAVGAAGVVWLVQRLPFR